MGKVYRVARAAADATDGWEAGMSNGLCLHLPLPADHEQQHGQERQSRAE